MVNSNEEWFYAYIMVLTYYDIGGHVGHVVEKEHYINRKKVQFQEAKI